MLMSILSACMLCAVAEAMLPNGPVRQAGKLVCGLVLLCAVLTPVIRLDWEGNSQWLEKNLFEVEQAKGDLENVVMQEWKTVIEEECATYIESKATELGISCDVSVICKQDEDGTWLPKQAVIEGVGEESVQRELARILGQELNIAVEFTWEEGA